MKDRLVRAGAALRRRHGRVCAENDRGYSILEAVITLPAAFLLLMSVVQWAIMWHARSVAQAAASEGVRTASGYQATAAAGQTDARNFLTRVAPRALPDPTVTATRTATSATVTIHSSVMTVVPFVSFTVDESATAPVETFTAP
ncbi:TadE-like protein [Jatrophihabitans sp. GAS493]|uniref:TadE/TadG family type IV pilus assembly protein n=1 Tax=Jatrophihabitans sp. GAS493 TaxID=1907575 RepID=UPI000BB94416|nr:TadE family protein [Jatrophihabitans sp. GAS493]SOD72943.1 TadE-like protein [Jatrophihabitans sp. GAS493]